MSVPLFFTTTMWCHPSPLPPDFHHTFPFHHKHFYDANSECLHRELAGFSDDNGLSIGVAVETYGTK